MNDLLPDAIPLWNRIERTAADVLCAYGYREIRFPIVEKTELYRRSIGEVTDIVEKEMYTFEDRNQDSLTLRPEGTAGCVRAGIENGLLYNQIQRLWYAGPMFRHERPQKGRYRQFHQVGVEVFGISSPDVDAELILISSRLWQELGIRNLDLEINSLGTSAARAAYRTELVRFLRSVQGQLDDDSQRRLESNPLRILDSKNPSVQAVLAGAPSLVDYLDPESRNHFGELQRLLDALKIDYRVNPRLVRGLDYYSRTVFEWTTRELGAQGTVCAGGRYDGLVEQLGGHPTPATGFAIGLERLAELATLHQVDGWHRAPHIFVAVPGDQGLASIALDLAEKLRDEGWRVQTNCGGGSLKSQMGRADKGGASFAVIVGGDEVARKMVTVKNLRQSDPQSEVAMNELGRFFRSVLGARAQTETRGE